MTIPLHQIGSTTFARINSSHDLAQILNDPWLENNTILIKPNWVSTDAAEFTDAGTLRTLFEALGDKKFILVESYCLGRVMNILKDGMTFTVDGQEVNWRWLLVGRGWRWLIENPGWEWFKNSPQWEHIRKEEQEFLDRYGFSELFQEFDVSYINLTEEVWQGKTVAASEIQKIVEARFTPVQEKLLYSLVPQKLYDLRGNPFISFARLKMYASFSMKNLFGMVPDPLRCWWHGAKNLKFAQNLVDINKISHALFNMYGMCEAIYKIATSHPEGIFEGVYTGKYNISEGKGVIAFGRNLVELDTLLLGICDPAYIDIVEGINRVPVEMAQAELGVVDPGLVAEAKTKVGDWLYPY